MIIYKTTNQINGKFYVGKDERNKSDYYGSGLLLNRAIDKYGIENFIKETIEVCNSREELNEREIYWINELNAITEGYNIALGGSGGDTYSENPNLPEIIKKLSGENNHFYGKTHSEESKRKIGDSKRGKPSWNSGKTGIYSEETKSKMSKARDKFKGENHPNFININEDELRDVLKDKSLRATAKHFNVSVGCIRGKIRLFQIER